MLGKSFGKVVSFQELGYGKPAGEANNVRQGELAKPLALVHDLGTVPVHHFEELTQIGLGILHNFIVGQHGAGGGASTRVADLRGPVADYQDELVPQVLQLAQFPQSNHVAQVNVRSAGVETHLQPEGLALLQQLDELFADDDVADTALGDALQVGRTKGHWRLRI